MAKNCILIFFVGLFTILSATSIHAAVLPGIDVLASRHFDILKGKKVGLITNHTGRTADGKSTIDTLFRAPGVQLVALFSPEHGIRGEFDEKIGSSTDSKTGLTIHSLYGKTCRPTLEMLNGVDILVFDIQDIGTRFYTYIGTLSLSMQAAKQANIPFVVLDRPNPINGVSVSGAIPDIRTPENKNGCDAITSIHPIPTRHGMTIGELARLFNTEYGLGCQLEVIPMQGWQRGMFFSDTGLSWVNPSPNMKSLSAAILYPGLGTLETTNLSVGRGTKHPFEMYGAPWVDSAALLKNLEERRLEGIVFTPCSFVPTAPGHPYRGKTCHGLRVTSFDHKLLDPVLAGLHLAQAFYEVHPGLFKTRKDGFAIEVGDTEAWGLLTDKRIAPEDVVERWELRLERFMEIRKRYLMYGNQR